MATRAAAKITMMRADGVVWEWSRGLDGRWGLVTNAPDGAVFGPVGPCDDGVPGRYSDGDVLAGIAEGVVCARLMGDPQRLVDRVYDAAMEFADDPQQALACVTELLEPHVTPAEAASGRDCGESTGRAAEAGA